MFDWLDNALDCGITELSFWEMTIAELERVMRSQERKELRRKQERAMMDYTLANLIGRSVARIHSSSITMPALNEVYPTLFNEIEDEEKLQEQRDEISVIRFKLFTQSYEKRFKEGEIKANG